MSIVPGVRRISERKREMLYYKIAPKCNRQLFLTLTLNPDSSAEILKDLSQSKDKDKQLWAPVEIITGTENKGFALVNKYDNQVISARGERQPLTHISIREAFESKVATWRDLPVKEGFGAIQLAGNNNMNLNVFGNGPYESGNTVGIHDWQGGEPNEL